MNKRALFAVAALSGLGATGFSHFLSAAVEPPPSRSAALRFEPNLGQAGPSTDYVVRGGGFYGLISPASLTLAMPAGRSSSIRRTSDDEPGAEPHELHVMRMTLAGANESAVSAAETRTRGRSHYFRGPDPSQWAVDVPQYESVRFREVYKGIDLVYADQHGALRYDFVVHPDSSADQIRIQLEPGVDTTIETDGSLTVRHGNVTFVHGAPVVYQQIGDEKVLVDGRFVTFETGDVGFELGAYDASHPVTIDPTLAFTGYFGGSDIDSAADIAMDGDGTFWIAGGTSSLDLPVVDPLQPGLGGASSEQDAYAARFDVATGELIFATYFGGSGTERVTSVALDADGNLVIGGETASADMPTVNAHDATFAGGGILNSDGFLVKVSSDGSQLVYATYVGGDDLGGDPGDIIGGVEFVRSIHQDRNNNTWVVGDTAAPDFPATQDLDGRGCLDDEAGANSTFVGDAFIARYSPAGQLELALCLGGSERDAGRNVAVDAVGNVYVNGHTRSDDFPVTPGAFQTQRADEGSRYDIYVTKLSPAANDIQWSTYVGGGESDYSQRSALNASGHLHVVGFSLSTDFPTTPGAFQQTFAGPDRYLEYALSDMIVFKLNASGSDLVYSTYLGGKGTDEAWSVWVGPEGRAYIGGETDSIDFPVASPVQAVAGSYFGAPTEMSDDITSAYSVAVVKTYPPSGGVVNYLVLGNDGINRIHTLSDDRRTIVASADVASTPALTRAIAVEYISQLDTSMIFANDGAPNQRFTILADGSTVLQDIDEANDATWSLAWGDFDETVSVDLVAGNYQQPDRLYYVENVPLDLPGDVRATTSLAVADLDGNGRDDIIAGNDAEPNRVYLQMSSEGDFVAVDIAPDADATRAIVSTDVNGDGWPDVIAGNWGARNRLYLNDGTGGFEAGMDIGSEADDTNALLLGDVNLDGIPDLLVANSGPDRTYLVDNGELVLVEDMDPDDVDTKAFAVDFETCTNCVFDVYAAINNGPVRLHELEPTDMAVIVLSPDGSRLEFSSYLGGSGRDWVQHGMTVDASGDIWVAGLTGSSDFPAPPTAPNGTPRGLDAVVARVVVDQDRDGVLDGQDNCVLAANSDQRDSNGDGFGNACDPDLNDNCATDFGDIAAFKAVFLTDAPDADFNGDGAVNFGDLAILKERFLQPPGPSSVTTDCLL